EKTPLNTVIHGRREMDGYSIEKVYLETMPGYYLTGNLYRPLNLDQQTTKIPGILCPHGHWQQGRFYDAPKNTLQRQLSDGAEKFPEGGRNPIQARSVHLARLGCTVFSYDMVGYADNTQISYALAHGFSKQRPHMNNKDRWGFFSPQAESHLQNIMGLQTWNSIRALDFISTLDEVDADRLAVTGASGGGTQTFMVSAIDPRVKVSMPAVMVSTAMQGGCTCENACLLRVGAGNVDFAAMFAPKPLGLTAADDWTVEMETKGFPELQQLYTMLGKADNIHLEAHLQYPHNYNYVCRKAMYKFMNEHLNLGYTEMPPERDYPYQGREKLTVWNDEHPAPMGGDEFESQLLQSWNNDVQSKLNALLTRQPKSLRLFKEVVGGAIDIVVGQGLPRATRLDWNQTYKQTNNGCLEIGGTLSNLDLKSANPVLFLYPDNWNQKVVIWITEDGKDGLYHEDGTLLAGVKSLIDRQYCVVGVDLLYQGEFLADGKQSEKTRRVNSNTREAAAYSFGFNHTLFARRTHDILTTISFVFHHESLPEEISLVALDSTGPLAIAARAQARTVVTKMAANSNGFRFAKVTDIHSPNFLPGGAKYFDLPGMLAIATPNQTWLSGEREVPEIVTKAYKTARASGQLNTAHDGSIESVLKFLQGE
ncbi:MAG: acetylxylan esterase, partial [Planctomycetota bacterium]|nr:acetylxylan esterase [Planctomycetota bacterium]